MLRNKIVVRELSEFGKSSRAAGEEEAGNCAPASGFIVELRPVCFAVGEEAAPGRVSLDCFLCTLTNGLERRDVKDEDAGRG